MEIEAIISQIKAECESSDINLLYLGIETDEDLKLYALKFLLSNLDAIEELSNEDDADSDEDDFLESTSL